MTKPTGGARPPGKKPFRTGARPGKPGKYSQQLIKKATAGGRGPSQQALAQLGGRKRGEETKAGGTPQRPQRGNRSPSGTPAGDEPRRFKRVRLDRNAPPERERGDATTRDRNADRTTSRERLAREPRTNDSSTRESSVRIRDSGDRKPPPGNRASARPFTRRPDRDRSDRNDRAPISDRPERERTRNPQPRTPARPSTAPATASSARARPSPARPDATDTTGSPSELMRIAKAMARSGLCSRRDAERWIADGRVAVNGRLLTTPAVEVGPTDRIVVDGQPLPAAEPAQLWRYYKPRGLVTTHSDPEGRPTVFDALPPELPRVVSIGRLDYNTEGLLLLTNDGELARHLELPATGWLRRYRVRAHGRVSQSDLDALKDGVTIEGVRYGGIEATLDSVQSGNMWLTIGLREGKNREVRRILGSLALEVNRLIRVSYGPFQLMELTPGMVEPVKRRVLADQLGPDAAQFGLTGAIDGYKARQSKLKPGASPDGDDD